MNRIKIEKKNGGRMVNLRYIQEILSHNSSKLTEIYTHLRALNLSKIKNPLDHILQEAKDR